MKQVIIFILCALVIFFAYNYSVNKQKLDNVKNIEARRKLLINEWYEENNPSRNQNGANPSESELREIRIVSFSESEFNKYHDLHKEVVRKNNPINCVTQFKYSDMMVCLPDVQGMKECVSNDIGSWFQKFHKSNCTIGGIYIDTNTFNIFSNGDSAFINDAIIVYYPNQIHRMDEKFLDIFSSGIENKLRERNIADSLKFIECWSPDKTIRSCMFNNKSIITISSWIILKNLGINFIYTSKFNDKESFASAKRKSDSFSNSLLSSNN